MVFLNSSIPLVLLFSVVLNTVAAKLTDDSVINDDLLEQNSIKQYVWKLEHEIKQLKEVVRKDRLRTEYLEGQLKLLVQRSSQDPCTDSNSHLGENPGEQMIPVDNTVLPRTCKSENLINLL